MRRPIFATVALLGLALGCALALPTPPASAALSATSAAPPSVQSGGLTWQPAHRTDPRRGLTSISCVSKTLCRAGDTSGDIRRWNAHTWQHGYHFPGDDAGIDSISCPSATFCGALEIVHGPAGLSYRPVTRKPDGTWDLSAQVVAFNARAFPGYNSPLPASVSCTSASFCMLVTSQRGYQTWNGTSWSAPVKFQKESRPRYTDVSCASPTRCVAVGDILYSSTTTVYTWTGSSWSGPRNINGLNNVWGLSCPTTSFCMLVVGGRYVTLKGSTISAPKSPPFAAYGGVSCTSATFCVATADYPHSGAIRWDGTTWHGPHHFSDDKSGLRVSCASPSFCIAVTDEGQALDRVDGTWRAPRTVETGTTAHYGSDSNDLDDVSCAGAQLCVLSDERSATFAFGGSSWSGPHNIKPLTGRGAISCASQTFCAAGTTDGFVQFRRNGHWTTPQRVAPKDQGGVVNIDCTSRTFCALRDAGGAFDVWNGSRWAVVRQSRRIYLPTNTLSCVSDDCVFTVDDGVSNNGHPDMAQTYVYRGSTGTVVKVGAEIPAPSNISCVSVSFCLSSGEDPRVVAFSNVVQTFDGSSWTDAPTAAGRIVGSDVSCVSTTFCVVVGDRWESTWDGTQLSAEQRIVQPRIGSLNYLNAVSCRPLICAAEATDGHTVVAK